MEGVLGSLRAIDSGCHQIKGGFEADSDDIGSIVGASAYINLLFDDL